LEHKFLSATRRKTRNSRIEFARHWKTPDFHAGCAPATLRKGADYPRAIMQAITAVKSMVVLLPPSSGIPARPERNWHLSVQDADVAGEACLFNLPPDFDYFLSTQQWLDASEDSPTKR